MKILAIETSCDETAIAIINAVKQGKKTQFKILGNEISSQIDIHKEYGGVFPALAKREHIKNLPIIFKKVLKQAKLKIENIDAIAVTTGPGLEPALWTGIVFAKEINDKYKIPIVPVNHMEGHIFSIFPKKGKTFIIDTNKKIFPILSLLVSGGHTELILIKDWMKYKKIGQTRDDASGEAFDKVARMLGLPYPGGPEVSRLASIERQEIAKGPSFGASSRTVLREVSDFLPSIILPRPMIHSKDYDFSFSGLKTAVLYLIRDLEKKHSNILQNVGIKQMIAREFEDAVVETLVHKTIKAIKEYKIKTLIVGGGVSANKYLQEIMTKALKKNKLKTKVHFPSRELTGDNALMIAIAGYFGIKNKKSRLPLKANGNLQL
ncbi:MAG TPA: tRNA (adenosine(37)-N6)-threonylcarbamoyltransferase complex transferase subunit TsaD [Candidatus Paceibacterota bacterium]|nr:tRNA (adenosine(37)-N6)-threonylcarbamoyltransferase complex transferase subunit TsaD [Candidatus Paceibacterota bacterium]